ncbi:hypothetical protein Tco_1568519 [Tanacetum coccineum]
MLWGIVTRTNVDYAELLWEEFVQAIQIFFAHQANLSVPNKKPTPYVIPYCRFTKLVIFYLGSEHNIHIRLGSPIHVTGDDYLLGNLKFVPKGKKDEVFGMPIPKELITEAIQNSSYYQQYLEMVVHKPTTKRVPVNGVAFHEPTKSVSRSLPVVEGKRKAIATDEQVSRAEVEMFDNEGDTKILNFGEEKGEDVSNTMEVYEKNSHVALAGPNPEPIHEDFIATVYPKVHKSLKHTTEEHVFLENPPSSFRNLSSMKNLNDALTYGDQFLYDKPMEEEPDKVNVETEVETMVTIPIHQASLIAPPITPHVLGHCTTLCNSQFIFRVLRVCS